MRREINSLTGEEIELPDAPFVVVAPLDLSKIDTDTLNAVLAQDGSVVRALAEVMFAEVNKLRVKTGDAPYSKQQFVTALKVQMRT